MSERIDPRVPDVVRVQITAMVDCYLQRCTQAGVAWADFYAALKAEQALGAASSIADLLQRVWGRLQGGAN